MTKEKKDQKPNEVSESKTDDPTSQSFSQEDFRELVSSFKTAAEAMKESATATPPPATPTGPSEAEVKAIREAAAKKYNEARERANEMAAGGDTAGANELQWQALQELNAATADPGNDPTSKALKALAKQAGAIAKSAHTEAFEAWGDEIRSIVHELPPEQQLDPAAWDNAVSTVKARHVDEIIERERQKLVEELGTAPQTLVSGAGTRESGDSDDELTPDQIEFCERYKFDKQWYAGAVKRYSEAAEGRYGKHILDEDPENLKIEPGKF